MEHHQPQKTNRQRPVRPTATEELYPFSPQSATTVKVEFSATTLPFLYSSQPVSSHIRCVKSFPGSSCQIAEIRKGPRRVHLKINALMNWLSFWCNGLINTQMSVTHKKVTVTMLGWFDESKMIVKLHWVSHYSYLMNNISVWPYCICAEFVFLFPWYSDFLSPPKNMLLRLVSIPHRLSHRSNVHFLIYVHSFFYW